MAVAFFQTSRRQQILYNISIDKIDNIVYRYKAIRLESFKNWPVTYIKPEKLAAAGFYFTGKGDMVKCFACHIKLSQWMEGDDPIMDHRRFSPTCKFICNVVCDGIPVDFDTILSLTKEDTSASRSYSMEREWCTITLERARHPYYSCYELRLETFEKWPTSKTQTKEQLAEAGFFYTNTKDHVLCFYCGIGISDWKDNDDPWETHAFWTDNECFYLLEIKGQGYLDSLNLIFEERYKRKILSQDAEATLEPIIEENSASNSGTCNIHNGIESISGDISVLSVTNKSNVTKSLHTKTNNFISTHDESLLCQICFEKQRGVLFMTCQHIVACTECSKKLNDTCPICRQHISYTLPVFF